MAPMIDSQILSQVTAPSRLPGEKLSNAALSQAKNVDRVSIAERNLIPYERTNATD
jgi:hypothetical protein